MARFDVDTVATTYHPFAVVYELPEVVTRQDGSYVMAGHWTATLLFGSEGDDTVAVAAFEEWAAFMDGDPHTVELPPPDDVAGGDTAYTNVFIAPAEWPRFVYTNVKGFSCKVSPILATLG